MAYPNLTKFKYKFRLKQLVYLEMKLSMPVINTIRFDTELELVGNRPGVHVRSEIDGYCFEALNENSERVGYCVGIRIRLNFYVDKLVNEAAGYLSETESFVEKHSTPTEDIHMLTIFCEDVFRNIKNNVQRALPIFQIDQHVEFPNPLNTAKNLSEGLVKLGLYNK